MGWAAARLDPAASETPAGARVHRLASTDLFLLQKPLVAEEPKDAERGRPKLFVEGRIQLPLPQNF